MTILCSCGDSNGPLLMFPRNIAVSSLVAGYLFNSVGNEEQSYWSLNTVISFVLGFSAGSPLIGVTVL